MSSIVLCWVSMSRYSSHLTALCQSLCQSLTPHLSGWRRFSALNISLLNSSFVIDGCRQRQLRLLHCICLSGDLNPWVVSYLSGPRKGCCLPRSLNLQRALLLGRSCTVRWAWNTSSRPKCFEKSPTSLAQKTPMCRSLILACVSHTHKRRCIELDKML